MSEVRIASASNGMVTNARVYDLDESLIASGYPMRTETWNFDYCSAGELDVRRANRLSKLATDTSNPAHEQCLSWILVSFDLTLSNKAWVEAERYRFLTFVSSESTMHRIAKFDLDEQCNEHVDQRLINILREKIAAYEACEDDSKKERAVSRRAV